MSVRALSPGTSTCCREKASEWQVCNWGQSCAVCKGGKGRSLGGHTLFFSCIPIRIEDLDGNPVLCASLVTLGR
jgi:hypothetical protein